MDKLDATRIIESQGRRGVVRAIDLPPHLRVDDTLLLNGRADNGDLYAIRYFGEAHGGAFGVFIEGQVHAQTVNLLSYFVPRYVFARHTEAALAKMLVAAGIEFTLVNDA